MIVRAADGGDGLLSLSPEELQHDDKSRLTAAELKAPGGAHDLTADDFQRDRALRRPAAASRIPPAVDPMPAAGLGPAIGYAVTSQTLQRLRRTVHRAIRDVSLQHSYLVYVADARSQDRRRLGPR